MRRLLLLDLLRDAETAYREEQGRSRPSPKAKPVKRPKRKRKRKNGDAR